jgi:hypothetical protein
VISSTERVSLVRDLRVTVWVLWRGIAGLDHEMDYRLRRLFTSRCVANRGSRSLDLDQSVPGRAEGRRRATEAASSTADVVGEGERPRAASATTLPRAGDVMIP